MALLEREPFLSQMKQALTEVLVGEGRIVLVSGESGIGKTTLVEAFTLDLPQDIRVLWGACDALFTPRPLGPLYDIAIQLRGNLAALLSANGDPLVIFSRVLLELQQRPTVIVFEDIHWADDTTLDLLRYIGRRVARTKSLLVLTYRDDELGPLHPLRLVLGDLAAATAARRVALTPLSRQAVFALIGDREIDAAALHHQTGGNPFFITEVLGSGGSGIPATVRDAVLARAARLSPQARTVLEAAAVIGQRIEPRLLAQTVDLEPSAVDECITVGMLMAQGDGLAFRHEIARQTILANISPLRKQAQHRLTLEALKVQPESKVSPALLAHHAEGAGDREAVLAYAPEAARQAAVVGAHREAARLYELALRFSDTLETGECALLLEAYALECDTIGQQNEGIAARRKALKIWRALDNPLKVGENLAFLMNMLTRVGQNDEAERVCREAIEILEGLPPGRELALAYRVQAAACLVNRDCQEALTWAEKALELAERLQDAEVLGAVHLTIGTAWLFLDYDQGRSYMEKKIADLREAGLDARVAHMYSNLGSGSGELHQFPQARRYLAEGISFAAEIDLDSHRRYMQAWYALVQMYQGNWPDAEELAQKVLGEPGENVTVRITALIALGRLKVRRGDADALDPLDQALALASRVGNLQRQAPVRCARAEAAWLAGDIQKAREEACAVYDLAVAKHHPWFAGELAFWRWRAGDTFEIPSWVAPPFALQIVGEWQAAAAAWEQLECPYEQARALADGHPEAKIKALQIFEQLGARPSADHLRGDLRAIGQQRLPPRPRASTRQNPFGLTDRQVEILSLLIEGLNNSAISTRLHISFKTVDHHVSAILAGLNVHTREEAANLARNHPHFKK